MGSRGKRSKTDSQKRFDRIRSAKSHERNLATMYALVAYDPFQDEVAKIRQDLRIGENATLAGTKQNWLAWAGEESENVFDSKMFQRELSSIPKERREGLLGIRAEKNKRKLLHSLAPLNKLDQDVDFLLNKFTLPLHYHDHIKQYILSSHIDAPQNNFSPTRPHKPIDRRALTITIYTQLSRDEIAALNGYIRWIGENELAQYWDAKGIKLAAEIKQAHRDRSYPDPDTGKRARVSLADLAEEYLGSRKKANQVSAMLRDLAKLQKERFGKVRKMRR